MRPYAAFATFISLFVILETVDEKDPPAGWQLFILWLMLLYATLVNILWWGFLGTELELDFGPRVVGYVTMAMMSAYIGYAWVKVLRLSRK